MSLFLRRGLAFCPKIGQSSSLKFNPSLMRGSNRLCWRKESVSSVFQNTRTNPYLMWQPARFFSSSLQMPRHSLLPPSSLNRPFYQRRSMYFQVEETPNPDSLKFFIGAQLMPDGKTQNFPGREHAIRSPLAMRLFEIEGIESAFFGSDFVSVNKDQDWEWTELKPEVFSALADFFSSGEALFNRPPIDEEVEVEEDEVVSMIIELINTKVRPMVQQDGGDVEYRKFEEGVVFLKMQGACSGCPSAPATLKMGIERLLMHWVPEVMGVVEVDDDELAALNQEEFRNFESNFDKKD